MNTVIRPAHFGDLAAICRLRLQRTAWLTARGSDQWSVAGRGKPIETFAHAVERSLAAGETWIADVDGETAGTITVDHHADPNLWSPWELDDAVIVHYMIVDLRFAGHGIGRHLLEHAGWLAFQQDRNWVRLDAWTSNAELHDYYRRSGFHLTRIAGPIATGPSRALFERRTESWNFAPRTRQPEPVLTAYRAAT